MPNRFGDELATQPATPPAAGVNRFGDTPTGEASGPPAGQAALAQLGAGAMHSIAGQAKGMFDMLSSLVDPHMGQKIGDSLIDAQVEQWHKAKEEYKQGNYGNAFRRGLAAATPLLGPLIENSSEKLTSGDPSKVGEGAMDLAGPMLLVKAAQSAPEIAGAVRDQVGSAVSAAKSAAGKVAGAIPDLKTTADIVGLASPRAAHAIRLAEKARQIFTPAAEEAAPAAAPASAAAPAVDPTAPPEGVPQAWWDRLSPPMKQQLRDKLAGTPPTEGPAAPVPPVVPTPEPLPASRQLAAPGRPPIVTPAPEDTSGVTVSPAQRHIFRDPKTGRMSFYYSSEPSSGAAVYDQFAPAANPAKAAFEASKAPEPQVTKIPAGHEGEPAKDFSAAPRAAKVKALADTMDGQISGEDAARLSPGDWQRLAKGLDVNPPSPKTVSAVIDELKTRAAARDLAKTQEGIAAAGKTGTMMSPSAAYRKILAARPEALKAARALAEMNR